MKSITIHNLDDPLDRLLQERAKSRGMSLNKTIKSLLAESLGIKPKTVQDHAAEFSDLFGSWSAADARAFTQAVKDFEKIDAEDWS
jgi:plasmid stability protein